MNREAGMYHLDPRTTEKGIEVSLDVKFGLENFFFFNPKKDVLKELLHYGLFSFFFFFNRLELYMKKNQECHVFICDPTKSCPCLLFRVLVYSCVYNAKQF